MAALQYKDVENTVTLTLRNKVTNHKKTIHADTLKQIEVSLANLSSRQRKMIEMLLQKFTVTIFIAKSYQQDLLNSVKAYFERIHVLSWLKKRK